MLRDAVRQFSFLGVRRCWARSKTHFSIRFNAISKHGQHSTLGRSRHYSHAHIGGAHACTHTHTHNSNRTAHTHTRSVVRTQRQRHRDKRNELSQSPLSHFPCIGFDSYTFPRTFNDSNSMVQKAGRHESALETGANLKKIYPTRWPHARLVCRLVLGARRTFLCIHY